MLKHRKSRQGNKMMEEFLFFIPCEGITSKSSAYNFRTLIVTVDKKFRLLPYSYQPPFNRDYFFLKKAVAKIFEIIKRE